MAGRNPLVAELLAAGPDLDIGDFGCGPGNLIPHVAGHLTRLTGVEQSATGLAIATEVARLHGVAFEPYLGDIRTVALPRRFDVIVTVNSVLPATRAEVVELFADDGLTSQAYHSPESMARELAEAGLRIVKGPTKVRYPWELVQRFDYGYFPEAPEEIWDWYVEAQIAP